MLANPNPSPRQALEPEWQDGPGTPSRKYEETPTEATGFELNVFKVSTGWCLITLHRGRGHGCLRWASWHDSTNKIHNAHQWKHMKTLPSVKPVVLAADLNGTAAPPFRNVPHRECWTEQKINVWPKSVCLLKDPTWGWLMLNMHRLYVYLRLGSPSQKQIKCNFLGWDSGTDCSCDRTRCLTRPTSSAFS